MHFSRLMLGTTLSLVLSSSATFITFAQSQALTPALTGSAHQSRRERFHPTGVIQNEDAPALQNPSGVTEAPTGFNNLTNGFTEQGPPFDSLHEDNVVPLRSFNDNRFIFEEVETKADGLGPTYNAQSCSECRANALQVL